MPPVADADIGFITDDLGFGSKIRMLLHEVPGKRRGIFLVVEDSLVRNNNVMNIAKNTPGHSGTETI